MTVRPEDERAIDLEMVTLDELQRVVVREVDSSEPADATGSELQGIRRSRQGDPSHREFHNNCFPADDELICG